MIYQEDAYLHQSNHWLGRLSLKWAIMCQVEHKTLLYLFLYLFTGDWYEYCVSVLSFVLLASWTVYLPDYTPLLFVKVNFLFKRLLLVVICSFTPVDVVSHHTTSSSSFIVANWQHCLTLHVFKVTLFFDAEYLANGYRYNTAIVTIEGE